MSPVLRRRSWVTSILGATLAACGPGGGGSGETGAGDGAPRLDVPIQDEDRGVVPRCGDGEVQAREFCFRRGDVHPDDSVSELWRAIDFDGDGVDELVTVTAAVLNLGEDGGMDRRVGPFGTPTDTADLDGDGRLDLITASGATTYAFLTRDGDEDFERVTLQEAGFSTDAARLVDVDADGQLDLLILDNGGNLSLYLGEGAGVFATEHSGRLDFPGASGLHVLRTHASEQRALWVHSGDFVQALEFSDGELQLDEFIVLADAIADFAFARPGAVVRVDDTGAQVLALPTCVTGDLALRCGAATLRRGVEGWTAYTAIGGDDFDLRGWSVGDLGTPDTDEMVLIGPVDTAAGLAIRLEQVCFSAQGSVSLCGTHVDQIPATEALLANITDDALPDVVYRVPGLGLGVLINDP